jgi:hypothetical protein
MALPEDASSAAAVAEGDRELRVRCDLIRAAQGHGHVLRHWTSHPQQIGVPEAGDELDSGAFKVVRGLLSVDMTDAQRAAKTEMPAEAAPSKIEKGPVNASRRTCIGNSGSPILSVSCSVGAARLIAATTASATPQPMLMGRRRPVSPMRPRRAMSARQAMSDD